MMRLVGAGLGRTGTHSLKVALERLLGGPCYHMIEVFSHPEHVPLWAGATAGQPDWDTLFDGYVATVDWPGSAFWPELAERHPDAVVLLSVRDSAEQWWTSASRTIFEGMDRPFPPEMQPWHAMVTGLLAARFTPDWRDAEAAMAAYERHNDAVRAAVPAERLVEWRPSDGWGPLCEALDVPVPDEEFPVTNTTDEFRMMMGL